MSSAAGSNPSRLVLNKDQAEFKQLVLDSIAALAKHDSNVAMLGYNGPGYSYQDYVVTIRASRDKRSCEVYRNRTGKLVFSMRNMDTVAINWQYIFLDLHLKGKIKEANG